MNLELYVKKFERLAKIRLYEIRYNFKTNKEFKFKKFDTTIKKNIIRTMLTFQVNGALWPGWAGLGRVGPGQFLTDIDCTFKRNIFCPTSYIEKINIS